MASLDQLLRRWQEAGLLDKDTVARIRAFEESRAEPTERPGFVEALVYLGLAVIGVGVVVLIGSNWQHLETPARIAIPAVSAAAALAAGWVMLRSAQPELRRGGQAAWLLALALSAATVAIAAEEAGMDAEDNVLLTAIVALVVSFALWLPSQTHVQVVGVAAAGTLLSISMAAQVGGDNGGAAFGVTLALFALAGLVLADVNILRPQLSARALSAIGLVFGSFYAGLPTGPLWGEAGAFLAGALLITLSIRRGVFLYMGAGVAAVFIGLVTAILRHIDDPTFAALALIAIGMLLLAGIIALERVRPWSRDRTRSPDGGVAATPV